MPKKPSKAQISVYKLLKENGRQSQMSDIAEHVISVAICLNVALIIFESMGFNGKAALILKVFRVSFFIFFLTEYILRVWVADMAMRDISSPLKSRIRYMLSLRAVINLLALMPVMLGGTFIDFRIFRILRLLWITQIRCLKQYTDILVKVFKIKGAQLLSSMFILLIFTLVCAVIIYDLENKAQPGVFKNVLSSIWWSILTITTVGYGDMYPVTPLGRIFGSFISIFGVFLIAVPVGILTSGFFEVSKSVNSKNDGASD